MPNKGECWCFFAGGIQVRLGQATASFSLMIELQSLVAGTPVSGKNTLPINSPYDGSRAGTVTLASRHDTEAAIAAALSFRDTPTRHRRAEILEQTRAALETRREEFARTITSEAGLALREARYEVGRTLDVLRFSAMEALRDDGQIFSGDISAQGKPRKIFTVREPLRCAVAITPFNHPLNQVAHKVGPAIAVGTPMVLKPSEKTPLVALKFAQLLFDAGLPGPMLSVLLGPTKEVAEPLVQHPEVDIVAFTGSVPVGKRIAATAGYKKLLLELGGNDPLIVLDDADMDLAVTLAAEGSYRNSGQRCTAVKRILVQDGIAPEFTRRLVEKSREYICGDPMAEATRVGTVIDEASAIYLESVVKEALAAGAKVLFGGERRGALLQPTVISDVPRDCRMVVSESFGPLAPILTVRDLDDALALANSTAYGLSSGVVTTSLPSALKAVRTLRCGTVNINEVPGFRVENSPFGGVKDSGLGVKEGVIEAMKSYSFVKTFSLPW
jgi:putative phosphonoacetaldehyde dehydrogenase